ncbi:MAG TPA: hypothetical protein VIM17_11875 [Jatrophihabitantaceae bacterium]
MTAGVRVRGNATTEELAVVVALISRLDRGAEPNLYAEWRSARVAAFRAQPAR